MASTNPPSAAPSALERLNAECIDAAAIIGASRAASTSTVWTTGARAKLSAPTANVVTGASTRECIAGTAASNATACAPRTTIRARLLSIRSARRPPRKVPAVMPNPSTASCTGTAAAGQPVTSVVIGAM